jgi:hypothetical protein
VRIPLFVPNKKWAVSPLISPPAGAHTEKTGGQTRLHLKNTAKLEEIQPNAKKRAAVAESRAGQIGPVPQRKVPFLLAQNIELHRESSKICDTCAHES